MMFSNNKANILGINVTPTTVNELHAHIEKIILEGHHELILNVNVNCVNLAYQHPWLREFLNSADTVFCDGFGVMLGAKILGYKISERITYADWMWQLSEFAEPREFTFFYLGGRPGIAEKAAGKIRNRFPGIKIVGTAHGFFNKEKSSPENREIIRKINLLEPNILVLGFGMPTQEKWLMENWSDIDANIALTGGATFDYISGELRRAPLWMTAHGLEWLGRLLIEPKRLWKRYILGNPIFLWRVLLQRIGMIRY